MPIVGSHTGSSTLATRCWPRSCIPTSCTATAKPWRGSTGCAASSSIGGCEMTDTLDVKRHRLPEWRVTSGGKRKHLGGRWNKERIAEVLIEDRQKEFTMDDLARLVYGSTSKT